MEDLITAFIILSTLTYILLANIWSKSGVDLLLKICWWAMVIIGVVLTLHRFGIIAT